MKEQLSQLVQDVIDGEESAIKAMNHLIEVREHINKCLKAIKGAAFAEINGSDKNIS